MEYASAYLVMDFRKTGSSQFELLAALCSISQEIVLQALTDFSNEQLISAQLLQEDNVRFHTMASVDLVRTTTPVQLTTVLEFLQISTRSNFLTSALQNNMILTIYSLSGRLTLYLFDSTNFYNENASSSASSYGSSCRSKSPLTRAGFYSLPLYDSAANHGTWPKLPPHFEPVASATVDGFFGGCNALDALLASTLDCLYDTTCLTNFMNYFPSLNQMDVNISGQILPSPRSGVTLKTLLNQSLIDNWTTTINYSQYFTQCAPLSCTYTETVQVNISYTVTLLLGLYGGLTILLRLLAVFLVRIFSKVLCHSIHISPAVVSGVTQIRRFALFIQQINLFKSINKRTAIDIGRQRVTTRMYLTALATSIFALILSTSLSIETTVMIVPHPSLSTYMDLQSSQSNMLKCPCSSVAIPYQVLISWAPTFHQ
ncbi:unnamed protein product, partial [Adineta ricciae]